MILRAMAVVAGLSGAAGLSQFPEFSQQYQQRLGGAVDELARVIQQFDRDAAKVGLSRVEALRELHASGPFGAERAKSEQADMVRYQALQYDLMALEGEGPFMRIRLLSHMSDRAIIARTWEVYEPAVPATFEGAVFAGTGFIAGWAGVALIAGLLGGVLRRRPAAV